jgi:hypothetical protein
MATKSEVHAYLRKNYKVEEVQTDLLKFIFVDGDRSQMSFAQIDDVKVQFFSPFAKVSEISAEKAFEAADHIAFGVKRIFDWYCLLDVAPIDNLDENELVVGVEVLSQGADEIERALGLGDDL